MCSEICRAPSAEGESSEATIRQRGGQLKALEKARAAERSIRNRLVVVIKALQYGWEFAAAYERIQGGAVEDPLEEKARKLMEEEKRKKEGKAPSRFGQRFFPYLTGSEAEGPTWAATASQSPFEQAWGQPYPRTRAPPSRRGPAQPFFCFQCGVEGHSAKDCPGSYQD